MKSKVALGMSGGVDSSVCAALLKEQGYDVTGVYLECWRAPGCRAEEDRKDALEVALKLGIPFKVLDFKEAYKEKVVEYFFREYEAGRTPNPDVLCNKEIKFGLFYDWAIAEGFDYVATGHYAQIASSKQHAASSKEKMHDACYIPHAAVLARSVDTWKDQTYFLYRLRGEQLPHILFPIGNMTKKDVRLVARNKSLVTAGKPDSQGICFIGEINVHNFLKDRLGERPGDVVDTRGRVIGTHNGLWFYTIGQRHGFTVPATSDTFPPYYVIRKDAAKNQLVVGFGEETYRTSFDVEDVHWINDVSNKQHVASSKGKMHDTYYLPHTTALSVRIRHTGQLLPCTIETTQSGLRVVLDDPTQGIAAGQSAVLYADGIVLGGGVIAE